MPVVAQDVALALAILCAILCGTALVIWRDVRRSELPWSVYFGFRALWLFCKLWHGLRPPGADPLPATGPAILISNHTSPADPLFLQCASRRLITFLMAKEYFEIRLLQPIFHLSPPILVNRTGRDTAAVRATLRALGNGRVVALFPEGGIHLDPDSLGSAKPGTAMLALLSRAPVIPALIQRPFHSNRLVPGILRPAKTKLRFGTAIDLSAYYERAHDSETVAQITTILMDRIAELRNRQRSADTTRRVPAPPGAPPQTPSR